jgi:anti-sigma regulatory factor (Ser/Thr protein kinase)
VKVARWAFRCRASSAREARGSIRRFLADADVTEVDREDAALVVSELVSNAVLHTTDESQTIDLRVDAFPGSIHIEVQDHDPRPPTLRLGSPDADRGRGLVIVDHIASRWGWDFIAGNGKQVWCDLLEERPRGAA